MLVGLWELVTIGLTGWLFFWLWLIAPKLGHFCSFLLPIGVGVWAVYNYRLLDASGRKITKDLLTVLALAGCASLLILSVGFVYGGFEHPSQAAGKRFSHTLPGDNTLPYLFAEGIRKDRVPKPLDGDWLSSDRPPLQTGCVLSQYTYVARPRELGYTIHSALLQSLWIFAAWLLLTAFDLNPRVIILALAVCLFSGFVFLNTFYVWPKLLAAAYVLGLFTILFTPKFMFLRNSRIACALAAALLALALLAHGASAFAVMGAGLTMLLFRRRVPLMKIILVLALAFATYAPWMLYQKFYDPPGNRLLKMHLAGVSNIDPRPFSTTLMDAYSALTPRQFLANKVKNLETLFQESGQFWVETIHLIAHLGDPDTPEWISGAMRGWMFFHFVIALGFLVIGPVLLLSGVREHYRTPEWHAAAIIWIYVAVTTLAYCLLKFTPGTTIIHAGTYATVLLAYIGSMLAIWAVSRVFALVAGCFQVTLHILLYGVFMKPPRSSGLPALPPPLWGCVLLGVVSLAFVVTLLRRIYVSAARAPEIPDCLPHQ